MTVKVKSIHQAQALIVYYATEMYGATKTIILCDVHRQHFYNRYPGACGHGEWRPAEECEHCKLEEK